MNTLRPEIKEWIKKYCRKHNFRINGVDVPLEYKTKDGRIVDNPHFKYTTQSDIKKIRPFTHALNDKITRAYNFINKFENDN